jgi:hypothetical protein
VKVLRAVFEVVQDLVIGDDWRVILGIALTLLAVAGVHNLGWPAWWVPPLGASIMLIIGVTTDPPTRRRA